MKLTVSLRALQSERYIYRSATFSYEALRQPLILPAVVDDFEWEEVAEWTDYGTVNGGGFSTPAPGPSSARQPRSLTLRILALDFDAPFLSGDARIEKVHNELMTILRCRKPFQILAGIHPSPGYDEVNMNASLRSVRRRLASGQPAARYFDASVVEDRRDLLERRSSQASRKRGVKLPAAHKIEANDTLSSLSRDYYGSPNHWRLIAEENGIRTTPPSVRIAARPGFETGRSIMIPKVPVKHVT